MKEGSPLNGIVTSERSSSSSESEDEECKLGIEDKEGMSLVSESTGAETVGRTGESKDDEGGGARMLRDDRTTVQ